MSFEKECKKCGKCCVVMANGIWQDCKFLTKNRLCSVYDTKKGKDLGFGYRCGVREELNVNFPGCPFNREGLPLHAAYK